MKTCPDCGLELPLDAFYAGRKRCKACTIARQCDYQRTDKGRAKQWRANLKHRYGITEDDYAQILAEQGGTCYFCPAEISPYGRRLSVDHDHVTGGVRGILCLRCNNQISFVDRVGLEKILTYLAGLQTNRSRGLPIPM